MSVSASGNCELVVVASASMLINNCFN